MERIITYIEFLVKHGFSRPNAEICAYYMFNDDKDYAVVYDT